MRRITNDMTRGECRMLGRAYRERWPIPDHMRKKNIELMEEAQDEAEGVLEKVRVVQTVLAMEAQNQADEHARAKQENEKRNVQSGVQINNYFAAGSTEAERLQAFQQRMLGVAKEKPPNGQ